MTKVFIKGPVRVGMVLENNTAALSGTNVTGVGSLYDGAANPTYAVLAYAKGVTIDAFKKELETVNWLADMYDHDIELRHIGSGSVELLASDDSTAANIDANNLIYAAMNLPCGGNSATGDLSYEPSSDTAVTEATDLRGYAVVVEQKAEQGTAVYYKLEFHNCRIEVTPSFSPKKTTTLTLKWSDARYLDFVADTSAFVDHTDA